MTSGMKKVGVAVAVAALGAALLWVWLADPFGGGSSRDATAPTSNAPKGPQDTPDAPMVVSWGGDGDILSVRVRNDDTMVVQRGIVSIEAFDEAGRHLLSSPADPDSKCCTVYNLPPGKDYGLFLDSKGLVDKVDRVEVRYTDVRFRRSQPATIEVVEPTLVLTEDNAMVRARLVVHGRTPPYVAGQAFLGDAQGRLVGVISAHLYCYRDDTSREVQMSLKRPVPPGTKLLGAVAYPVPRVFAPSGVPACTT